MYPFIQDRVITDLSFGSGFALWGFRAIASGQTGCCQFTAGFNHAFAIDNIQARSQKRGLRGKLAMNALKSFACQLGHHGRRKIIMASPGTMKMTADELCIIAALSAAQAEDQALCEAHLTWLLGHADTHLARQAAVTYALICSKTHIEIKRPEWGQQPLYQTRPARDQDLPNRSVFPILRGR